jgi:hypothetical protein
VSEVHEVYEREVRDLPCFEVPHDGGDRTVSGSMSGLRDQGGEDRAGASGSRRLWARRARVRRRGKWRGDSDWRRARWARSTCAIWNDGPPPGASRRCGGPGQNPWSSRKQPKMRVPSNSWRAREVWHSEFRDKPSLEKCIHASIQHHPDVKLILRRSLAENTRSYPTGHPLAGG